MKHQGKGFVPGRSRGADGMADGPPGSDQGGAPVRDGPVIDLASARARRPSVGANEDERGSLLLGLAYLATLRGEHFLDKRERKP
jgi:hypothetical protein